MTLDPQDTVRSILEVALVLLPVVLAILYVSRHHEREAKGRLETMLDAFHEHEEYDRKSDAELLAHIDRLKNHTKR